MSSFPRYHRALSRIAAVSVLVAACGEYAHTNPYDPATSVTLSVQVKAIGAGRAYVIAALGASLDSVAISAQ